MDFDLSKLPYNTYQKNVKPSISVHIHDLNVHKDRVKDAQNIYCIASHIFFSLDKIIYELTLIDYNLWTNLINK